MKARILCPSEYIGNVQKLCHDRRGVFKGMTYLDTQRVELDFELPLSEIVLDFYDRLKSQTRGYAALDYEFLEYRPDDFVKLDILVNGDPVDAFSVVIHESKAYEYGRDLVRKLKESHPPATVPGGAPGIDRQRRHRANEREGAAQERHREVLRG